MTDYSSLLACDRLEGGVALITLNRPEARNALSAQLRRDLSDCLANLTEDDAVRSVVLTGNGDIFCAGFDIKELSEGDTRLIFADALQYHRDVYTFAKPLIGAINGPALAGGMDLAAMCDIRISAEQCVFAQPQVRMGIPSSFELMRTVLPEPLARHICLTGEPLSSEDAVQCGFVLKATSLDSILDEAVTFARNIPGDTAASVKAVKSRFVASQPSLFGG